MNFALSEQENVPEMYIVHITPVDKDAADPAAQYQTSQRRGWECVPAPRSSLR